MKTSTSNESHSTDLLRLQSVSASDAQLLGLVIALGACVAAREGALSAEFVCDKLLRPSLPQKLERVGLSGAALDTLRALLESEDIGTWSQTHQRSRGC